MRLLATLSGTDERCITEFCRLNNLEWTISSVFNKAFSIQIKHKENGKYAQWWPDSGKLSRNGRIDFLSYTEYGAIQAIKGFLL